MSQTPAEIRAELAQLDQYRKALPEAWEHRDTRRVQHLRQALLATPGTAARPRGSKSGTAL